MIIISEKRKKEKTIGDQSHIKGGDTERLICQMELYDHPLSDEIAGLGLL